MSSQTLQIHRIPFTKLRIFSGLRISSYADTAELKSPSEHRRLNMQAITSDQAEARFLEVVLPEQANHYGTLYGANTLQIMGARPPLSAPAGMPAARS